LGLGSAVAADFAAILDISKGASVENRRMCAIAELSAAERVPTVLHQGALVGVAVAQLLVVSPGDLLRTAEQYSRRPSAVDPMAQSQRQTNFFRVGDRAECAADGRLARVTETYYESPVSGDSYAILGIELAVLRGGRLATWYSYSSSPQETTLLVKKPILTKGDHLSRLDSWLIEHEESFGCDVDRGSYVPLHRK
jgi:hypothetical protein